MKALFVLLACVVCGIATAAPPPAPVITVAATDVRQLEFNWEPVSGVQWYELWFRSAPGAAWVKYDQREARLAPLFRIGVPVHLLNWTKAIYAVKACNYGGCRTSNYVDVYDHRYGAIGFFKPPRGTTGVRHYGNNVVLSADGNTMAVTSSETIGTAHETLVANVYRRTSRSSAWRLETRLTPAVIRPESARYLSATNLALSGDGNVLVLGAYTFGASSSASDVRSGTVDVFRRSGPHWSHSQTFRGSGDLDFYGNLVQIDDAARTLVIHNTSAGVPQEGGTLEIYRAPAGGTRFALEMTLPPPPRGTNTYSFCPDLVLSGDGNTLVRGCYSNTYSFAYVHTGPGFPQTAAIPAPTHTTYAISHDGTALLIQDDNGAQAYRLGTGGWRREASLTDGSGVPDPGSRRVAISRDGKIAAVGNYNEPSVGRGPLDPPFRAGYEWKATGGVMVYQYKPSGWQLRRLVKPGSYSVGLAGMSVSLSGNGNLLAVGAPTDPSAASGIDGSRVDTSAPDRGAVWLY